MNLRDITPLVLTFNEAPNIGRCLAQLRWAERVVVIDSGSTDNTAAICREFSNVELIERSFDNHTAQWNFGLDQIATNWVLTLDADYKLTDEFVAELRHLEISESPDSPRAWSARFTYVLAGKQLRGTLYPPRVVLFEVGTHRYEQDGHTQILKSNGPVGILKNRLDHDDRKPLSRWLDSQRKYASLEADKLSRETHPGGFADRLRILIWPAAPAAFLYTLLIKKLILDGWPGIFYTLQRTHAELLLSLELLDRRINGHKGESNDK